LARKILLADDSVTAQNMGRKILADAGYEVITVNNGSAALKKIGEQKPDLIVLDVYMPGYSGLEVCQRLKDAGETARIPVLLSVGKLEPFKTDEAKRVRADGYIIKPFEASELLSALSKLEDKIVPRAEASKPGRLARASAAIDEGRSEKAPAEDSGWKSRISFPAKKKNSEVAVEADGDDPAIYNAVNKDLRTVVDHSRSAKSRAVEAVEEESVDLGALAPEGLPKDVTPEEIAALAAAAAQVQGRVLENKAEESTQAVATSVETADSTEKVEAAQSSTAAEPATVNAIAAIGSETSAEEIPEGCIASEASNSAEAPISPSADGQQSGEPATMAALVASDFQGPRPHWTVVAVDLAPEDAGVSLEQEMQQAYAAYAATQSNESSFSATDAVATAETSTISEVTSTEPEAKIEPVGNVPVEAAVAAPEFQAPEPSDVMDESQAPAAPDLEAVSSSNDVAPTLETITEPALAEITSSVQPEIETATTSQQDEFTEGRSEDNNSAETTVATAEPLQNHEAIESVEVPAAVSETTAANGISHSAGKESDMAASTAAAWANWRRSRESRDTEPEHLSEAPSKNAMAVAAGAESAPEEAAVDFESDPAIASIVDSVLADLRPKIVEEISRKLGKKR
jgi:CheY-like chemotaxis protein